MLNDIKRLLLLTLSAPVKPGSVHRLMGDFDFERRLLELVEVEPYIEEAYRRGQMLGQGKITAQELGLGSIISKALRAASAGSEETPLVGLWSAAVSVAAMDGYAAESNMRMYESLRILMLRTLYASLPDDGAELLEGISDVGDSDLISYLSSRNVTENYVRSNKMTLGDLFEALSEVDKGFAINLRGHEWLLQLTRKYEGSRSLLGGLVKVYLTVASEVSGDSELASAAGRQELDLVGLMKLDRRLSGSRAGLNRSLGAVFLSAFLAVSSNKAPKGL